MDEPVINQPKPEFGIMDKNNLEGLEKLFDTKELTMQIRRPSFVDCEYNAYISHKIS